MNIYLAVETFFPGHLREDLNVDPHAGLTETQTIGELPGKHRHRQRPGRRTRHLALPVKSAGMKLAVNRP
ncbi:hypothetical protein [Arthrobacter globiformis]|uniref:hypothetical protein n=1 Tax=Arthrobacter globiformis TaxID=1665 RepID=UPI0027945F7B|nr:hypothetical protein [Arthrobacter globiformis]MDQ0618943.1 hypothetical protein [Arthrobacter globiformis]